MIQKITNYSLYGEQTQKDGSKKPFVSDATLIPQVKNSRDIEKWEDILFGQTGLVHKITIWHPTGVKYIWFPRLKAFFKRKK